LIILQQMHIYMKLRLQTHQWCSHPKNWGGFGGAMAPLPPPGYAYETHIECFTFVSGLL